MYIAQPGDKAMVTPLAAAFISSADEQLTGCFLSEDVIEASKRGVIFSFLKFYNFTETFFFFSVTQKNWIMVVKPEICFKTAFSYPKGFPCGSAGKESACNVGDLGSISGLGGSPGDGKGYPLPVFWPRIFHGLL